MNAVDGKGKQRKTYPFENMMRSYEKLKFLPNAEQYLKPEITLDALGDYAMIMMLQIACNKLGKSYSS